MEREDALGDYRLAKRPTDWTDEELLAELRRVAQELGKPALAGTDLIDNSPLRCHVFKKRFGSWNRALTLAGLEIRKLSQVSRKEMLDDIRRVWDTLEHQPSREEYERHGNISYGTIKKRFHGFSKALSALNEEGQEQNADAGERAISSGPVSVLAPPGKDRLYGEVINFRGMQHGPVNEQGVVFLFGLVAKELGFIVEGVQQGFPDCDAKQYDKKRRGYIRREMEFELNSKNFVEHGHPLGWRGIIVCWEDDWPDHPLNIDIIALKDVLPTVGK